MDRLVVLLHSERRCVARKSKISLPFGNVAFTADRYATLQTRVVVWQRGTNVIHCHLAMSEYGGGELGLKSTSIELSSRDERGLPLVLGPPLWNIFVCSVTDIDILKKQTALWQCLADQLLPTIHCAACGVNHIQINTQAPHTFTKCLYSGW